MKVEDVTLWGRDYSAREFTPEEFDRYERENPQERPVQWLDRYIGYPLNAKCISHYPGMYRRHWEAGRPVSLFHQIGYSDMEGGYERGRQHAGVAMFDAKKVGWNGESHITACMDRFYAKPGYPTLTRAHLAEYMRGFRSVLGDRAGFYGFYDSMRDAIREGWASFYVQCGARSAHVPGIHAWQENNYQPRVFGTATDVLELYCSPVYAFGGIEEDMPNNFTENTVKLWHAWFEDMMRRTQQMHSGQFRAFEGVGSTDTEGNYSGTENPPHWMAGGDLTFLDDKIATHMAPVVGAIATLGGQLTQSQATVVGLLRQLPAEVETELGGGLTFPPDAIPQLAAGLRAELAPDLLRALGERLLGIEPQAAEKAEGQE